MNHPQLTAPTASRYYGVMAGHHCKTTLAAGPAWPKYEPTQEPEPGPEVKPKRPQSPTESPKPKDIILAHLDKHGPTTGREFRDKFGITRNQLHWATQALAGIIFCEQIGNGANRASLYWSSVRPATLSQRCNTFKTFHFFQQNPWSSVADIPTTLVPRKGAYTYTCDLERNGKLVSRVRNKLKQYKVVEGKKATGEVQ